MIDVLMLLGTIEDWMLLLELLRYVLVLGVVLLIEQELSWVYLLCSTTGESRHKDVSYINIFVVFEHLEHLLSMLKFMA